MHSLFDRTPICLFLINTMRFLFVYLDRYDEFGRQRSSSLNATLENLILSKKSPSIKKLSNKPRGSVPTLTNIPRKMLIRQSEGDQVTCSSLPSSPLASPNGSGRNKFSNPLRFMRKHHDRVEMHRECCSPKSKRAFEPPPSSAEMDLECTSFRQKDDDEEAQKET